MTKFKAILFCFSVIFLLLWSQANAQSCGNYCRTHNHSTTSNIDLSYSGRNYCSEFSACSIDRDLSGATGEELQRYKTEKTQDGETFSDWTAPDFTLPTTTGDRVSLSDYRGQLVALILMSGHCSHCFDTHKILPDLQDKYASKGLAVLPVYINSGSVKDVRYWSKEMNLNYSLLVSQSTDIF